MSTLHVLGRVRRGLQYCAFTSQLPDKVTLAAEVEHLWTTWNGPCPTRFASVLSVGSLWVNIPGRLLRQLARLRWRPLPRLGGRYFGLVPDRLAALASLLRYKLPVAVSMGPSRSTGPPCRMQTNAGAVEPQHPHDCIIDPADIFFFFSPSPNLSKILGRIGDQLSCRNVTDRTTGSDRDHKRATLCPMECCAKGRL